MLLSEKYKSDNVTDLITEQTSRIMNGITKNTKLVVIVGEQGSGKTTLARYIQDRYKGFEISDDLDWLTNKKQLEKIKNNAKNIVVTTKLANLHEHIIDSADVIICTSNKDSKIIIDRLKYIVIKEGIKIDDLELAHIADKCGQNVREAINTLHRFKKDGEYTWN